MSLCEEILTNLQAVQSDIAVACRNAGRDTSEVKVVAVTKYAEWSWVEALSQLHKVFGENRPQQLAERQPLIPDVQWHLIGQLQRNKVRLALQHAAMIHSVDSLKLLQRIAETAEVLGMSPHVLLQLNLSGETTKSGFAADELSAVWPDVLKHCPRVRIDGLMTMAAETGNPEEARNVFRSLRKLRDELAFREDSLSQGVTLRELSMGMSGDFGPAVEEGATLVRIGSRLFAGLGSK